MENKFSRKFDKYVCEGDSITAEIDGFTITAQIVRDDYPGRPDEHDDGFWPSLDPESAGYIGSKDIDEHWKQLERAEEVMRAWKAGEWFYCGVVLSISRDEVELDKHAASLWGIECNYPKNPEAASAEDDYPNDYLTETANELLDEALDVGMKKLGELLAGLRAPYEPQQLFATPESMDVINAWIERHAAEERAHLYVLQGMYYNFIVSNYDLVPKQKPII